jgi:hypothetical protein
MSLACCMHYCETILRGLSHWPGCMYTLDFKHSVETEEKSENLCDDVIIA